MKLFWLHFEIIFLFCKYPKKMRHPYLFLAPIVLSVFISSFGCIYAAPPSGQSNAAPQAVPQEIQKALQLPEGDERTKELTSAGLAWERQDPHAAMEWAFSLPNDKCGFNVIRVTANDWGAREPVPATTEWVMSHSPKEGQLTGLALHFISTAWARVDPSAASAWAEKAARRPENNSLRLSCRRLGTKRPAICCCLGWKRYQATRIAMSHCHCCRSLGSEIGGTPEIAAAWAENYPLET